MNITSEIVGEIIENKDIYVDFQPIYSLNTKKIIGLEALARGDYHKSFMLHKAYLDKHFRPQLRKIRAVVFKRGDNKSNILWLC